MKELFFGVVQWASSHARFPLSSFIEARDKIRRRKVSKVKQEENQLAAPLLPVEPRALTSPLPDASKQQTNHQPQSPLFKLPYELRLQIYELVLGSEDGKVLHIIEDRGRLSHIRCYHIGGVSGDIEKTGWERDCCNPWRDPPPGLGRHKNLLALPKTCRRMYVYHFLPF
jgi:hypothetical protein